MDNVTHTLFALTLARTPLGRGRGTTVALVLASSAPDVDIVTAVGGSASYLEWHRGPTHGPLGVIGLGVVTALIVWACAKHIGRRDDRPKTAPFLALLLTSLVGVLAHILMDLPTSYGTRLLSPFSWRWFAADLMPIIDIYLLGVLAAGLAIGRGSPRARRIGAAIALTLMGANYTLRAFAHQAALTRTERLFGPTLPGPCDPARQRSGGLLASWDGGAHAPGLAGSRPCLVEIAAIPTFGSPFRWRVIARTSTAYELYDIDLLNPQLRSRTPPPSLLTAIAERVPDERNALTEAAARAAPVQALLAFSRFPQARVVASAPGAATVRFTDMRFDVGLDEDTPLGTRRQSLFTATVTIREAP